MKYVKFKNCLLIIYENNFMKYHYIYKDKFDKDTISINTDEFLTVLMNSMALNLEFVSKFTNEQFDPNQINDYLEEMEE